MTSSLTALPLADGSTLPAVGLGTWKIPGETLPELIPQALEIGYRHIDSAADYGNEVETGIGLRRAMSEKICSREELWVTSKLWNTHHHPDHVAEACEKSLQDLGLEVLDLYLIHFPISLRHVPISHRYPAGWVFDPDAKTPQMELAPVRLAETWSAMETLVQRGLVRHIGVSNFNTVLLTDLLAGVQIRPSVLQVELHPYLTQPHLLRFCQEQQIAVTGYSPFGAGSYVPLGMAGSGDSVLLDPVVLQIAGELDKSAAQIVLRWGIQRGTAVVPKSSNPQRLAENLAIFDFALSAEQMAAIDGLNRNQRFNDPGVFCESAFNTFCPIYD